MMFVNILIFFAFFLVSDALESSRISGDVPEDLQKRMNNLGISTDGNMTECASEDKICSFFDCNDQWYFASCSKHYYLCAFEMCNYYCLRCECQSCYTDHCNLPLSMRPNLTTTTMHMDFNRTSNTEEPETTSYQDLSEPPLYENPCIMIGKVSSSAGLAKHVKPLFLLRFMLLLCQVLMMMVSS
ncbi:hypothetical protein niasHS_008387 [Heterodera schachtii]|uniref:Uncharacterized protein n=1 Tax=Heterodera schachtii TaxID=97005 RepID=A0ABD2J023_HETSC